SPAKSAIENRSRQQRWHTPCNHRPAVQVPPVVNGDALVSLDHHGRVLLVNRAFERIVEQPLAEIRGRTLCDICPPEIAQVFADAGGCPPTERHAGACHVYFPRTSEQTPRRPISVLVVDDEAAITTLFDAALSRSGFYVMAVHDATRAIPIAVELPIDVALIDLVMPDQEGIETIQAIHAARPQLKIVAMSGAFGGGLLPAARALGACAVLPKPVLPRELVAVVETAIAH